MSKIFDWEADLALDPEDEALLRHVFEEDAPPQGLHQGGRKSDLVIEDVFPDPRVAHSSRGFKQMEPLEGDEHQHPWTLRLYESSIACGPYVWLAVEGRDRNGNDCEITAHLSLEQARQLRDQLDYLIHHHYQIGD